MRVSRGKKCYFFGTFLQTFWMNDPSTAFSSKCAFGVCYLTNVNQSYKFFAFSSNDRPDVEHWLVATSNLLTAYTHHRGKLGRKFKLFQISIFPDIFEH